jgi:release factor glutamine methyltransferase
MAQTLETLAHAIRQRLQGVTRSPEQASAEADRILEATLGINATDRLTRSRETVTHRQADAVEALLAQRVEKRIPIQYLLHEAWFYGLKLYVNPHVLIPRPETELLVDRVLEIARPGVRILELGTGPGSIALALSSRLKDSASLVATDISELAIRVARINQRALKDKLGQTLEFRTGDLFDPVAGEGFDVIVSNPPYVDESYRAVLDAEVLNHEPHVALFSPTADPYYFYGKIAAESPAYLNPGGHLILETGAGMTENVANILSEAGFQDVEITNDYAGMDRMVCARLA